MELIETKNLPTLRIVEKPMIKIVFEDIYRENYKKIFCYIKKRIYNSQDAEELVQDIFTSIYKNMDSFHPNQSSFSTWMFAITNNRLKNFYRDYKTELPISEFLDSFFAEEDPIEITDRMQYRESINKALKGLTQRERTIIIQRFFAEKKAVEVAKEMGLTPGNIRIIQKRALVKMKGILERDSEYKGIISGG